MSAPFDDRALLSSGSAAALGAADVEAAVERIYGGPLDAPGVLHVTAVWRCDARRLTTIKIAPGSPGCRHDLFALSLARARADAILTSGKILREEPELSHAAAPGEMGRALDAWRREALGKREPPLSVVLTSGRDLDLGHPLFRGPGRALIYTSKAGGERLATPGLEGARHERGVEPARVEVVAVEAPSARGAIAHLRGERGLATVSIEAGPSTSRGLYEEPVAVDELMLSVYEEPELAEALRGGPFLGEDELEVVFERRSEPFRVASGSGRWSFRRLRRALAA